MATLVKRAILRSPLDGRPDRAGRSAGARPRAVARGWALKASYLVDANIVSATAPAKSTNDVDLVTWMDAHLVELHLSAVSIAEIKAGIAGFRRRRATRRAGELEAWLKTLLHLYAARVLPFDIAVARLAGRLADQALGKRSRTGLRRPGDRRHGPAP